MSPNAKALCTPAEKRRPAIQWYMRSRLGSSHLITMQAMKRLTVLTAQSLQSLPQFRN